MEKATDALCVLQLNAQSYYYSLSPLTRTILKGCGYGAVAGAVLYSAQYVYSNRKLAGVLVQDLLNKSS